MYDELSLLNEFIRDFRYIFFHSLLPVAPGNRDLRTEHSWFYGVRAQGNSVPGGAIHPGYPAIVFFLSYTTFPSRIAGYTTLNGEFLYSSTCLGVTTTRSIACAMPRIRR